MNKIICWFRGHYWLYRSPKDTWYKACKRCSAKVRDDRYAINGKLVERDLAEKYTGDYYGQDSTSN